MEHKAGYVNIIGNPNVGKSTLMNALVGERLSIITSKAQTTRHRILGIVNDEQHQIVFSDTPDVFLRRPVDLRLVEARLRRVVVLRRGLDLRRVVRRRVVVFRRPRVFRAAVDLRRVAILFPPDLRRLAELRFFLEALARLFVALFLLADLRLGFRITTSCSGMSINLPDILPTYK